METLVICTMERCQYCDKEFTLRKNLYRHIRKFHTCEPKFKDNRKGSLICPKCGELHRLYKDLRDHLVAKHDVEIKTETVTFTSKEAFSNWKRNKEREIKCFYKKITGTKGDRSYYVCHRSYVKDDKMHKQLIQTKKRKIKRQGYSKLSFTCPSTMQLTKKGDEFKVELCLPHVGHACSLEHINLTLEERTEIASLIAEGVSFEDILDHVRDNVHTEETLSRMHLLNRQDLRNIKKEFSLNSHIEDHKSDAVSRPVWVEMMNESDNESPPVLYYKPQGQKDGSGISDEDEDEEEEEEEVNDIHQVNDSVWEIISASGDIEYIVEKTNNWHDGVSSECELFCGACHVCVHDFCCTCPDSSIHLNICKHIDAVLHFHLRNKFLRKSEKIEEFNLLIENIVEHNIHQNKDKSKRLELKLDQLHALVSQTEVSHEVSQQVEKYLDNCINLVNRLSHTKKDIPPLEPSNKNITKQIRFKSTKNKRITSKRFPTVSDKSEKQTKQVSVISNIIVKPGYDY